MVVFDTTFLLLLFNPASRVPGNKEGVPHQRAKERIEFLIEQLSDQGTRILIPTPALSELLVKTTGGTSEMLKKIKEYSCFDIVPFDEIAAIEVGIVARSELGKKSPDDVTSKAKVKYDRQIVAIAKTRGASMIYSDDKGIKGVCEKVNLPINAISDLPLRPQDPQDDMFKEHKRP
ncbi:MAG: hypothetical protein ABI230_06055 [Aestuariivirga sp.]